MLNEHFAILVDCIEAGGGTVDKYVGDSVMASWEPDEDGVNIDGVIHAARQIRHRVTEDNIVRRREQHVAPCVRIGIRRRPARTAIQNNRTGDRRKYSDQRYNRSTRQRPGWADPLRYT
jgi:class 3 adenylate cyclase